MTEHLPECNYEKNPERNACICQRLRACEERMLTTYLARDNFESGLNAAREAVGNIAERWDHWEGERRISMEIDGQFIDRDDALAVIDALRKDSHD